MRILIFGNTYISEVCTRQLIKDGYNVIGYVPSLNPTFKGNMPVKEVGTETECDIKLSIQYDRKIDEVENAYNLHTGLLPDFGGCSILYHTVRLKQPEQGLTFHKMTEEFDAGGIISKMTYAVLPEDTVPDLYQRLATIAPGFISNALKLIKVVGKSYKPTLYKRGDVPEDVSKPDTQEIQARLEDKKCKVISICFQGDRDVRTNVIFPAHNQNSPTSENMLQMVKDLFDLEIHQDAGCDMDIYFINNDVGFAEGNEWLESINGTKTKNGTLHVLVRPNTGGSFASYDFAYQTLKNRYKWFMFTEEDLFILGRDYYLKAIERFKELNVGFLAFIDIERYRNLIHAHGGVGLTTRDVLEKVTQVHGSLPHSKIDFDKQDVIRNGEIMFTNIIDRLGYSMGVMGEIKEWDEKNNILPYFNYKRLHNYVY